MRLKYETYLVHITLNPDQVWLPGEVIRDEIWHARL